MKGKTLKIKYWILSAACLLVIAGVLSFMCLPRTKVSQSQDLIPVAAMDTPIATPTISSEIQKPMNTRKLHVPIFMYHHVGSLPENPDALRRNLTVSAKDFEEQLQWLKKNGYESVSLQYVYLAVQGQHTLPKKPMVVTFDDGYSDVFENAVPLLKKYGYIGSFAVMPGFTSKEGYATWEQIVEAKKQGMEIISHTQDHFDGTSSKYNSEFIRSNLTQSLEELDSKLGEPVPRILIYPYGRYSESYVNIAKEVGFVMALTVAYGQYVDPNNLMATPRVRVHGGASLEKFEENLLGKKK